MDSNTIILLVAAVISLVIFYYIISSAVKSGTEDLLFYEKMQYRLQIGKMLKEGHSYQEIVELLTGNDDDFWNKIRKNYPSDENTMTPKP